MQIDPNHKNPAKSNLLNVLCAPDRVAQKLKKNKKIAYRPFLNFFADLIVSDSQIPILIDIEKKCFPTLMQDECQNFEDFIKDEYASGLILYENGVPIGYIMGCHIHETNSGQALEENDFIQENEKHIFYISSLAIIEEYRSITTLGFLLHEMSTLLKSIDYQYFVAYVRKRHGLSRLLTQRLAATVIHTVDNWEETGEPFDFCLVNLDSIPTLPLYADYLFHWIRKAKHRKAQRSVERQHSA